MNKKHRAIIKDIQIVRASLVSPGVDGQVMYATMVEDITRGMFLPGEDIRTSLLVNINAEEGVYETLNTIYYEEK